MARMGRGGRGRAREPRASVLTGGGRVVSVWVTGDVHGSIDVGKLSSLAEAERFASGLV